VYRKYRYKKEEREESRISPKETVEEPAVLEGVGRLAVLEAAAEHAAAA
jgi:hypothetical protein